MEPAHMRASVNHGSRTSKLGCQVADGKLYWSSEQLMALNGIHMFKYKHHDDNTELGQGRGAGSRAARALLQGPGLQRAFSSGRSGENTGFEADSLVSNSGSGPS